MVFANTDGTTLTPASFEDGNSIIFENNSIQIGDGGGGLSVLSVYKIQITHTSIDGVGATYDEYHSVSV